MTLADRHELERRFTALRAEARSGAMPRTFDGYEELCRAARAAGMQDIAAACLEDLATLVAQIDPETAKALAAAAAVQGAPAAGTAGSAALGSATPDLTVVVLGAPVDASASPAVRTLAQQTLDASRFETILADGTDAAACNAALAAARGRIVLFVDADLALATDVVERHRDAHTATGADRPGALLGAVEIDDLELAPLAWSLEKIGLGCAQTGAAARLDASGEFLTTTHLSLPVATLRAAGGFDPTLAIFAGPDLGARLDAQGVHCVVDPALRARRAACSDLDLWLRRWRAMGADWRRLRAKHGDAAPPSWLKEAGLEPGAIEPVVSQLLGSAESHARCVDGLRESLGEIGRVVAKEPRRAAELLAKVEEDLTQLVLQVMRHEVARGYANAATQGDGPALERCATGLERGAAVLVLKDRSMLQVAQIALENLPAWGELVVAWGAGSPVSELPADPRIVRMRMAGASGQDQLKEALLGATRADLFLLLDGTSVPTVKEWEAARLTLGTLPCIGACNVEEEAGVALTRATLRTSLATAIVAVRRDVIENDPAGAGPFLERLVQRGYRLAHATAACGATTCVSG